LRQVGAWSAPLALSPTAVEAHEKWFIDAGAFQLRLDTPLSGGALPWIIATIALTGGLAIAWRARGHRDFIPAPETFGATASGRRIIYALLPLIIGVHTAIALVFNGINRALFSPNVALHGTPAYLCGVVEIWIGLALLYGGFTRLAALALAALWFVGLALAGPEAMLDNMLYLGIAAFFFLAGRGPVAIDRLMFPFFEPSEDLRRWAVTALRIGLGVSFAVVAFTEKLANHPLALGFLQRYPLNFSSLMGVPISDRTFVLAAGSVELLIGLCLIFGLFAREIIIVAWLPINLTLTYFGAVELVGHLPIYGIMALLLIWIPDEANREQWLQATRLSRTASDRAGP